MRLTYMHILALDLSYNDMRRRSIISTIGFQQKGLIYCIWEIFEVPYTCHRAGDISYNSKLERCYLSAYDLYKHIYFYITQAFRFIVDMYGVLYSSIK